MRILKIGLPFSKEAKPIYESVSQGVIRYVQQYLVNNCNMLEVFIPLPEDNNGKPGANNVFMSSKLIIEQ